jgi:hypothetical protein
MTEREAIIVYTFATSPAGVTPERFTSIGDRVWAREAKEEELDSTERGHIKWWVRPVDPKAVAWAEDAARPDTRIGVRQGDIVWADEKADWG